MKLQQSSGLARVIVSANNENYLLIEKCLLGAWYVPGTRCTKETHDQDMTLTLDQLALRD